MSFDTGYDLLEIGDTGDEAGGDSYEDDWTTGDAYDDDAASRGQSPSQPAAGPAPGGTGARPGPAAARRAGAGSWTAQPPTPQAAVRAVRSADLDSRVRDDMLWMPGRPRSADGAVADPRDGVGGDGRLPRRPSRRNRFPFLRKPLPTAVLLSLPLLAMAPIRSDKSLGGWLRDPRFIGIGGVCGGDGRRGVGSHIRCRHRRASTSGQCESLSPPTSVTRRSRRSW